MLGELMQPCFASNRMSTITRLSWVSLNRGIDLHAGQMYVCVMDHRGKKLAHANLLHNAFNFCLAFPHSRAGLVAVGRHEWHTKPNRRWNLHRQSCQCPKAPDNDCTQTDTGRASTAQ